MCTLCNLDASKTEAFAQQLLGHINGGLTGLMISLGHRTGLFDTMAEQDYYTAPALTRQSGLSERYVREWLGAMTAAGVVECEAPDHPEGEASYRLPAEHAASLTRAAGSDNMAVFTQYLSVLGGVEEQVLDHFRNGGGVSYSEYPRFHEVMAEDSGQSVLPALIDHILPIVPGMRERLEAGIRVLDIGCGRGRALNILARNFPNSQFVGFDLSEEAMAYAKAEAAEHNLANIRFEQRDLSTFDETAPADSFDLVTAFDAIHDQARPDRVLRGIRKALRPNGAFLMQDIKASTNHWENTENPLGPFIYSISLMHCMTVSLAQGGMGLGAAWGWQKATAMLKEAGFESVEIKELDHDIQNYFYICE